MLLLGNNIIVCVNSFDDYMCGFVTDELVNQYLAERKRGLALTSQHYDIKGGSVLETRV
jgi:hypothetical protein